MRRAKALKWIDVLERADGFEPSTLTLARLCSTPELRPHSKSGGGYGVGPPPFARLSPGKPPEAIAPTGLIGKSLIFRDVRAHLGRLAEGPGDTGYALLGPALGVMALVLAAPPALTA